MGPALTSPSQIVTFSPTLGDPQLGKAQAKQSLRQCYGGIGSKAISLAEYKPRQRECDMPSQSATTLLPLYLCVLSMWDRLNLHLPLFTMTPTSIVCHFNLPHIQLAPSHFLPFLTIQITRSHTPTPHLGFPSRITYPCIVTTSKHTLILLDQCFSHFLLFKLTSVAIKTLMRNQTLELDLESPHKEANFDSISTSHSNFHE